MAVRTKTLMSEVDLANFMNQNGLSVDSVTGPFTNSSGHLFIFYDAPAGPSSVGLLPAPSPAAGVSFASASGASTVEVGESRTVVSGEVVGAISGGGYTGTLTSGYVVPGTVELTDSGGTGPTIVDNGSGILVEKGTATRRGTINYSTKAITVTYAYNGIGTGNLLADYQWSAVPDAGPVPEVARLTQITVTGAAGNIAFEIYEDEAKTKLAVSGTIVVVGGIGTLALDHISRTMETVDLTKRDRRWVVVDGACDVNLYWERVG